MARQLERVVFESESMLDPMLVDEWALQILEYSFQTLLSLGSTRRLVAYSTSTYRSQRCQINDAVAALAKNPGSCWSLPVLADLVGLSPGYLSRTFREHTGSTITQYLMILRVIHALQLLPDYKGNLASLAYESGFSSHAHMSTSFLRLIGVTPSSTTAAHQQELISRLAQESHTIHKPI